MSNLFFPRAYVRSLSRTFVKWRTYCFFFPPKVAVYDSDAMIAFACTTPAALQVSRNAPTGLCEGGTAVCSLNGGSRRSAKHYVNLTNGIEALPALTSLIPPNELRFTRLQSSHCEIGAYDKILREVDHDMLWSLANGHT